MNAIGTPQCQYCGKPMIESPHAAHVCRPYDPIFAIDGDTKLGDLPGFKERAQRLSGNPHHSGKVATMPTPESAEDVLRRLDFWTEDYRSKGLEMVENSGVRLCDDTAAAARLIRDLTREVVHYRMREHEEIQDRLKITELSKGPKPV